MLRHVVLFKWLPGTTDAQVDALAAALAELPAAIPAIRRYEMGPDAGLSDANFDYALVADFDDADGYRAYSADETHRKVIADHVAPIADTVVRSQYEV